VDGLLVEVLVGDCEGVVKIGTILHGLVGEGEYGGAP